MSNELVFFVSAAYVLGMFVGVFAGMSANIVTKITGSGVVRPIATDRELVVLSSEQESSGSLVDQLKPRIEPVFHAVEEDEEELEEPQELPMTADLVTLEPAETAEPADPVEEELPEAAVASAEGPEEAEEEPIAAYDANNVQALRRMIQKKREMEAAESDSKRSRAA